MQSPVSSVEGARTFDARLIALLAWQTRKYTKGESTSVTVETARELLASLRYTIAVVTEETHIPQERLMTERARAHDDRIAGALAAARASRRGHCRGRDVDAAATASAARALAGDGRPDQPSVCHRQDGQPIC